MKYNKLVRNKIHQQIAQSNPEKKVTHRIVQGHTRHRMLIAKLHEEIAEYLAGDNEELADVLEVVYALADHHGMTNEQLQELAYRKRELKGSFSHSIVLVEVED